MTQTRSNEGSAPALNALAERLPGYELALAPATRAYWAPRPDPDHVPEPKCTCNPTDLAQHAARMAKRGVVTTDAYHFFLCACSVPQYKRAEAARNAVTAWDKASRQRERASAKLATLSTPKGWASEWRAMQRAVAVCPVEPMDGAIQRPASRYRALMGETPVSWWYALPGISPRDRVAACGAKLPHVIAECASCKAAAITKIVREGFPSTGAWSCGCNINGVGSCRVGVDQSVTVEHVIACERHRGAFDGPALPCKVCGTRVNTQETERQADEFCCLACDQLHHGAHSSAHAAE